MHRFRDPRSLSLRNSLMTIWCAQVVVGAFIVFEIVVSGAIGDHAS